MPKSEGMPIEGVRTAPLEGLGGAPISRPPIERAPIRNDDLRSDLRSQSMREAEEYAREIMETRGDAAYEVDEFYIDPSIMPAGWGYQWKSSHIAGKENGYHILNLQRAGWRPVPASRHKGMMPDGWEGAIEKKGLILMELPQVLIDRANKLHTRESKEALRNAEGQLYETPANTGPRDDPGLLARGINKVTRETINPRQGRADE